MTARETDRRQATNRRPLASAAQVLPQHHRLILLNVLACRGLRWWWWRQRGKRSAGRGRVRPVARRIGPSKKDGALRFSRGLSTMRSLHAQAGVRDTGMSRGRGREACVRTSGRGVVCREQWPSGSNRRIGANELWPARIVAMAVGTMTQWIMHDTQSCVEP